MRSIALLALFFTGSLGFSQSLSLPIDFEKSEITYNFVDFDGGTATVLANPQSNGINTSEKVAQIVRNGGEIWGGSKIALEANLDFTTLNNISMKVFTTAPIGTTIKFKLEGTGDTERDVETTVSNEWETLTWDFTGEPSNFNMLVFMFDFGNVGDGSESSTFLFDDIAQIYGGDQIDLTVDFESSTVNYTMSDFGGNESSMVTDPYNPDNLAMKVIKTPGAATWAGTTIGTPAGFATNIPLTLSDSKMSARVWAPAGTPIRLKVEDSNDPTHTCETETNTTVSGWQALEFDFINQAPGTQSLSIGLGFGWTYNMASIFFNFGTEGNGETYYFDDVLFGGATTIGINNYEINELSVFPNPANSQWTIHSENADITLVEVFDLQGKLVLTHNPDNRIAEINASDLVKGIYLSKVSTNSGTSTIRLAKK